MELRLTDNPQLFRGDIPVIKYPYKIIKCNERFNSPLIKNGTKALPNGLKEFYFGLDYNHAFVENGISVFPDGIETIHFPNEYGDTRLIFDGVRAIPDGVKNVYIHGNLPNIVEGEITAFPDSIEVLHLGMIFNQPYVINGINWLPPNLKKLVLEKHVGWDKSLIYQPKNDGVYKRVLPDGLKIIEFINDSDFNGPLVEQGIRCIPDSVEIIYFGREYRQPLIINGICGLPPNIKLIHFENENYVIDPKIVDHLNNIPDIFIGHDITNFGDILFACKCIKDILPMPIADEIIDEMYDEGVKYEDTFMYSIRISL